MTLWMLAFALSLNPSPSCVYLRAPVADPSRCESRAAVAKPSGQRPTAVRVCGAGLPPSARVRFLPSGDVCAGEDLYEPVMLVEVQDAAVAGELPEWGEIARLCRRGPVRWSPPRRWWLPTIGFSAERSLQWSSEGMGFSSATTFWLTLSFPFPTGQRAPPPPDRRCFDDLCTAARRLNRVFATVTDAKLRTRARLQLMAWRDELEALAN